MPGYGPRDVLQVFRILQEAVTNALKHSGGSAMQVMVGQETDGAVRITISDNGKGGASVGDAGRGLSNMRSRAQSIGAICTLESPRGGGTQIVLLLPPVLEKAA